MAVFVAGTTTIFNQTSSPTGWTKGTSVDNYALRIVSGTGGGTGGSVNFSQVHVSAPFNGPVQLSGSVSALKLTVAQLPSHQHAYDNARVPGTPQFYTPSPGTAMLTNFASTTPSTSTGTTTPPFAPSAPTQATHTHPIGGAELGLTISSSLDFRLAYIDCIQATRD